MIQTTNCVICFSKGSYLGGHVHRNNETICAMTCPEHMEHEGVEEATKCKGCYGEWKEEMGLRDQNFDINRTYGTYKSELLKEIIVAGHKPIGITVMVCEETFIFTTASEANEASNGFMPEGWWYGLDGKYTWAATREQYIKEHYDGDESRAPTVYWLDNLPIYCVIWDKKLNGYYKLESPWKDEDLLEIGFEVKQRYNTEEEALKAREIAQWNFKYEKENKKD
jgi:hypothetical protein